MKKNVLFFLVLCTFCTYECHGFGDLFNGHWFSDDWNSPKMKIIKILPYEMDHKKGEGSQVKIIKIIDDTATSHESHSKDSDKKDESTMKHEMNSPWWVPNSSHSNVRVFKLIREKPQRPPRPQIPPRQNHETPHGRVNILKIINSIGGGVANPWRSFGFTW